MIKYKYLPYRDSFLEKPFLRATQLISLNDPFEAAISDTSLGNYLKQQAKNMDWEDLNLNKKEIQFRRRLINDELSKVGVISLAEEPDNLLMWSHYAKEHTGYVIGLHYDKNFQLDIFRHLSRNIELEDEKGSGINNINVFPEPVMYRSSLAFSKYCPSGSGWDLSTAEYVNELLLTKSNDWMYEKEHRYILPLQLADKIVINESEYAITIDSIKELSDFHTNTLSLNTDLQVESDGENLIIEFKESMKLPERRGLLNYLLMSRIPSQCVFLS
jgi:hypothetical protein